MPIASTACCCHQCGYQLSDEGIARAHFLKKCPACNEHLTLNAPGALTRSKGATAAGLAGMALGLGACVAALTALGIDEKTLNAWPAAWQVGLAVAVVSTGSLVAYWFQRLQVGKVLAGKREQLKNEGLLMD